MILSHIRVIHMIVIPSWVSVHPPRSNYIRVIQTLIWLLYESFRVEIRSTEYGARFMWTLSIRDFALPRILIPVSSMIICHYIVYLHVVSYESMVVSFMRLNRYYFLFQYFLVIERRHTCILKTLVWPPFIHKIQNRILGNNSLLLVVLIIRLMVAVSRRTDRVIPFILDSD